MTRGCDTEARYRRHPMANRYDREIGRLAVPAFFALVAEPLYVLADTAIVGHLGRHPLGGLGVAGAALTGVFGLCNFLAYGTTAAVARRVGAGDDAGAADQGVAGMWLALGLGLALLVVGVAFAGPVVDAFGASAAVRAPAVTYLRISALGAPFVLLALAGTGYLRGTQDTRTPLVVAVAANVVNLVLEVVLVYGVHLGIAGSAWGTVVAQIGAAAAFVGITRRAVRATGASLAADFAAIRATAVVGAHLVVRTAALLAAFLAAAAVAARVGDPAIAAHQVAWQVWMFCAFALDAIAIAGQAIVGRALGAGDDTAARAVTRRMLWWGWWFGALAGLVVLVLHDPIAAVFTDDPEVRRLLGQTLCIVALMQPVAGLVFVLDGILIGAGDARYLAQAMVAATAVYLVVLVGLRALGGGLLAAWGAIALFLGARLLGLGLRWRGRAWMVLGG